jgi:catechol 2,3-dioxygenase-like lactoylglutathione lyase family enzyme
MVLTVPGLSGHTAYGTHNGEGLMFSHVMIGANDIDVAKQFYDATFVAIGGKPGVIDAHGRIVYQHNGGIFIVTKPIDGNPATGANGGTIGFAMPPAQADAWWQAGKDNGGTAVEDPPGPREGSPYYLAYLRDPSGNKLCALSVIG